MMYLAKCFIIWHIFVIYKNTHCMGFFYRFIFCAIFYFLASFHQALNLLFLKSDHSIGRQYVVLLELVISVSFLKIYESGDQNYIWKDKEQENSTKKYSNYVGFFSLFEFWISKLFLLFLTLSYTTLVATRVGGELRPCLTKGAGFFENSQIYVWMPLSCCAQL